MRVQKNYAPTQSSAHRGGFFHRVSGVGLLGLACVITLSTLSYHSADPSWNRASDTEPQNLVGGLGASIADMLLQILGLASIMLCISLIAWGWRLGRGERLRAPAIRVCALSICLLSFAVSLACIPTPDAWPIAKGLGGAMGHFLKLKMLSMIPLPFIALFSLFFMLVSTPYALGLKRKEWRALFTLVKKLLIVGTIVSAFFSNLLRFRSNDSMDDEEEENYTKRGNRRASASTSAKPARRSASLRDLWHDGDDEDDAPEENESRPSFKAPTMEQALRSLAADEDDAPAPQPAKSPPHSANAGAISASKLKKPEPKQTSLALRPQSGNFVLPDFSLLKPIPVASKKLTMQDSELRSNSKLLESVLQDFGVKGEIVTFRAGPVVTLYELEPTAGTRAARVIGLADDIARTMSAVSARISVIPGRNAIGIELPNVTREMVSLREMLEDTTFQNGSMNLPMALGKDIAGEPVYADLATMPHLLVAGTTGSGKSVAINTMILSLVYALSPEQCKFIMIDPKMLELSIYDGIPHLLAPVVTEPAKAVVALKWAVKEMENRNKLMAMLKVRNIDGYNKRLKEAKRTGEILRRQVQTGFDPETGKPIYEEQIMDTAPLPFIVVIVDEMADLMLVAGKDVESSIQRLAQMARAAGIHIIMATQRPSVDVITGVIKANFPTRISFQVTSRIDSRTILGEQGAEQLLGKGDMLYMKGGGRVTRVHGPFVSDEEVQDIVAYLKTQGEPSYVDAVTLDEDAENESFAGDDDDNDTDRELYDQAVALVSRDRKASTSYIQRYLKIGYNRAARLIEKMEREGVVSSANHVGKREVLTREYQD